MVSTACPALPGGSGASGRFSQIAPALTDGSIRPETLTVNFAITPATAARGKLVVLFNGTGAGPLALQSLGNSLADDGYHVIGLRYESGVGTLDACPDSVVDTDPECHRNFRSEVVFGAGVLDPSGTAHDQAGLDVSAANSVVNRLLKLVEYLRTTQPAAGWETFQQRVEGTCTTVNTTYGACELDWPDVVTGGHSQGAGVALYLAKFMPLDRVMMLSGPFDVFDNETDTVAPWITEAPLQVPSSRIGMLSHEGDPAIARMRAVADALALPGVETNVTTEGRPYGGSLRLLTDVVPPCLLDSAPKHNSTATDACSPPGAHADAWRYLVRGL